MVLNNISEALVVGFWEVLSYSFAAAIPGSTLMGQIDLFEIM